MKKYKVLYVSLAIAFLIWHTVMVWHYSQTNPNAWGIYMRGLFVGAFIVSTLCLIAFRAFDRSSE